jgi:hypothetical protein
VRMMEHSSSGRGLKRMAFGWYGGTFSYLSWLLPLLPETSDHCEPFGGSLGVGSCVRIGEVRRCGWGSWAASGAVGIHQACARVYN